MTTLLYLMYGIEILVAILLIAVILIQRSKSGGGLGGLATTSAGVEEAFGSSAGNVLVKATVTLGLIFVLNTTGITICQGIQGVRENQDALGSGKEQVQDKPAEKGTPLPAPKPKAGGAGTTEKTDPAAKKDNSIKTPPAETKTSEPKKSE